jgi:hypothetical protein
MIKPTHSYGIVASGSNQISYEEKRFLTLLSFSMRNSERRGMQMALLQLNRPSLEDSRKHIRLVMMCRFAYANLDICKNKTTLSHLHSSSFTISH